MVLDAMPWTITQETKTTAISTKKEQYKLLKWCNKLMIELHKHVKEDLEKFQNKKVKKMQQDSKSWNITFKKKKENSKTIQNTGNEGMLNEMSSNTFYDKTNET